MKNRKAIKNPKNKDNECLRYAVTVALNYEKIQLQPKGPSM